MENNGFILFIGGAFTCLALIALPVFLLASVVALGLAIVRYRKLYVMDNYYTLLVYRLIDQPESLNQKPMVRIFAEGEAHTIPERDQVIVLIQYRAHKDKILAFMKEKGYQETKYFWGYIMLQFITEQGLQELLFFAVRKIMVVIKHNQQLKHRSKLHFKKA